MFPSGYNPYFAGAYREMKREQASEAWEGDLILIPKECSEEDHYLISDGFFNASLYEALLKKAVLIK